MKFDLTTRLFSALSLLAGASASVGSATAQHADALLIVNPDGHLVAGLYDFDGNSLVGTGARVFEGEFDAFGTTDEPGFNALSNTNPQMPTGFGALPGNTAVGFEGQSFALEGQNANLWFWNATGPVSFSPVTDGTVLNISKAPAVAFSADLDGSATDVPGFTIDTTAADGFLHKHIDFSIIDATTAATGFYLWALEISAGPLSTEPLFFVHGLGDHDEALHEQAIEYVETNLVPEPGSVALLATALVGGWFRRR